MISVIYPLFNDANSPYLRENLIIFKELSISPHFEIIIVDGGSSDETIALCEGYGFSPIVVPDSTRIGRLKRGAKHAKGEMLIFHHPRTTLEKGAFKELLERKSEIPFWGGFQHQFDKSHPLLKFTSWYSNQVRLKIRGIVYLDHCLFLSKDLITIESIKDVPIFEDTILSVQLRKMKWPVLLKSKAITSAIRFEANGVYVQAFKNQMAKLRFYFSKDFERINTHYEKGLNLNHTHRDLEDK